MKYLIVLIIALSSCTIQTYDWTIPVEITSPDDALKYIDELTYTPKATVFLPEELFYQRYGDCDDFALMLQFILETELNIDADLVGGYYNGSTALHMWVEAAGIIYEPTAGTVNNNPDLYEELYRYSYPQSIRMVKQYGGFIN